jgi:DNA-binding NarL/FixJ family response regulator
LLLAHEHALFREALRAGLERYSDLAIVEESPSGPMAKADAERVRPAIALIDSELPPDGGISVCAAIKNAGIPTKVLLMCSGDDHRLLVRALEAGAEGYVRHEGGLSEIVDGCHALGRDEAFIPPRLLAPLLRGLIVRRREGDAIAQRAANLSRREKEVFALLVAGQDQQGIAEALVISPATARTHLQNVLRKLDVHSRLEATALAIRHDLVPTQSAKGMI